ncbi:uncharacterized protein LAJ45_11468 [Morchella importuna]|uniref:uncharacterized protein n=1 Tax=Morchella importuna TaxID=1174673 RepID=UPI001E8D0027|nr:uncharacterized protein LAJ45_11468 [Morchella importuna]KAH8144528.1 hypothetical protein LAJ45_11468 [Morchella importuna]
MNQDFPPTCPRCLLEDEDLEHAILRGPERSAQRATYIPFAKSLDDLWSPPTSLAALSSYIRDTKTGYPPQVGPPMSPPYDLSSDFDLTSLSSSSA